MFMETVARSVCAGGWWGSISSTLSLGGRLSGGHRGSRARTCFHAISCAQVKHAVLLMVGLLSSESDGLVACRSSLSGQD